MGTNMEHGAMMKVAHDPRIAAQHTRVPSGIVASGPVATTVPEPSPPTE
jgi:hypothetical protein